MQISDLPHDRRRFLRLALGFSTGALLAGCGGGGGSGSDAVAVVSTPSAMPVAVAPTAAGSHPLNLALNMAYLGAQYHGFAARGVGLAGSLTGGIGQAGGPTGARQAMFADSMIADYAIELADDKSTHVTALRSQIGPLAAAQPQLDLSTGANGAFALATRGAGAIGSAAGFDPYAGDTSYLIGAFLIENAVAAAYRTLLGQTADVAASAMLGNHLGDAIYHGGLIRSLLDDKAAADPTLDQTVAGLSKMLARIDGTNTGDQTLANAVGASSDILDADGRPIPFTRAGGQVLQVLYLSASGVGGFLPAGANGVPV